MHEASLVRSLLNQVERLCEQHGGQAVEQIDVEVGPLSGVEPLLLREAFEILAPQCGRHEAALVIHEVALVVRCRECNAEFELPSFDFACPECPSKSIQIIKGDEFRLLDVTIQVQPSNNLASSKAPDGIGQTETNR